MNWDGYNRNRNGNGNVPGKKDTPNKDVRPKNPFPPYEPFKEGEDNHLHKDVHFFTERSQIVRIKQSPEQRRKGQVTITVDKDAEVSIEDLRTALESLK
jgi:hypothetical protein